MTQYPESRFIWRSDRAWQGTHGTTQIWDAGRLSTIAGQGIPGRTYNRRRQLLRVRHMHEPVHLYKQIIFPL